jgi:putative pyrroloquinoline-quinone-binding quinoprotein
MYRGDLTRDGHPAEASLGVEAAKHLKPAWQVEMSGGVSGTPAVAGGVVVAASAGGVVAALGHLQWARDERRHGVGRRLTRGCDRLQASLNGRPKSLVARSSRCA